jgi:hypothetical protein
VAFFLEGGPASQWSCVQVGNCRSVPSTTGSNTSLSAHPPPTECCTCTTLPIHHTHANSSLLATGARRWSAPAPRTTNTGAASTPTPSPWSSGRWTCLPRPMRHGLRRGGASGGRAGRRKCRTRAGSPAGSDLASGTGRCARGASRAKISIAGCCVLRASCHCWSLITHRRTTVITRGTEHGRRSGGVHTSSGTSI